MSPEPEFVTGQVAWSVFEFGERKVRQRKWPLKVKLRVKSLLNYSFLEIQEKPLVLQAAARQGKLDFLAPRFNYRYVSGKLKV